MVLGSRSVATYPAPELTRPLLERNFFVLHTIFGISMIVGFERLGESSYSLAVASLEKAPGLAEPRLLLFSLAAIIALIGIRFFWAVDNVTRYQKHCETTNTLRPKELILLHYPVLFLHSFLFFLICQLHKDLSEATDSKPGHPYFFIYLSAALLLVNAVWLLFLVKGRTDCRAQKVWIVNNFACGGIMICTAALIWHYSINTAWALGVSFLVLLINSAVDMYQTSKEYS